MRSTLIGRRDDRIMVEMAVLQLCRQLVLCVVDFTSSGASSILKSFQGLS